MGRRPRRRPRRRRLEWGRWLRTDRDLAGGHRTPRPLLEKHGLQLRSLYVNSTLHDPDTAAGSTATVLDIAAAAKPLGTTIVVTNPSPIRWGGTADKDDSQLKTQARHPDSLGAKLRDLGLTLAYHNHDAELRQGARGFHHMLTATSPDHVKLCLDSHWVFRGCGDSQVALFDALEHYHDRVVELHLRQSRAGTWTETFTMQGDIDYTRLSHRLAAASASPHLVLEQAVEAASPDTLDAAAAHTRSVIHLRDALA